MTSCYLGTYHCLSNTSNNSFKPNLFRYGKSVAKKACHAFSFTAQVGLIQALGRMSDIVTPQELLLSLQRALLGEVHSQLRQASIEADGASQTIRIRFEYDGTPQDTARESCSCAATEVIADFPTPWDLDEQHVPTPASSLLSPLAHVAYRRAESQHAA